MSSIVPDHRRRYHDISTPIGKAMTHYLRVREHPLGLVIEANGRGELLIPDEGCCGMSFTKLRELAKRYQPVEVDDDAAADCPVLVCR